MATLVTGAFGCIGAWVCKRLLEAGERPVAFDVGDDPWRMRMLLGDKLLRDVVMVRGDIADREGVTRAVGEHKVTRIIHLAAWQVPLCRQDPSRGALINVVGTANVFEAAKAHRDRVGRVAYFSSAAVFGPPHLYGPGPVTDDAPPRPATPARGPEAKRAKSANRPTSRAARARTGANPSSRGSRPPADVHRCSA